jgi:hypothetical protein
VGQAHRNSANISATLRIVRDLGGKVLEVQPNKRHILVKAVTLRGNRLTLVLSKSRSDPFKLKGWTRQKFNKADAAASRMHSQE